MSHSQLHPLQVNPATGEPFLRLPSPLKNIIITPPRMSDAPFLVQNLNDPSVRRWLKTPPYPYLPSHAESWLPDSKAESDDILRELEQASLDHPDGPLKIVGGCPVRTIREVKEDGTDVFIGDIYLHRCAFQGEEDAEEEKRLCVENAHRELGDPDLVWCIGDYLASSHHGRGIMSAALGALLSLWAVPRMAARRCRVEIFEGNIGSMRVFEKNGFVLKKTLHRAHTNSFGETKDGTHIFWWERR
ncbi:GNAT domain-containing protein [Amylocystis lapponica]|nr:GNAT domain-containing protein [Amylocystis lapponica]